MTPDLRVTLEDAVGQARLVREGAVSSADLVTAAIARIEAVNPVINAVVTPLFEFALSAPSAPGQFQGRRRSCLKDAGACLAGLPLYAGSGLVRSLLGRPGRHGVEGTGARRIPVRRLDEPARVRDPTDDSAARVRADAEPLGHVPILRWIERRCRGGGRGRDGAGRACR